MTSDSGGKNGADGGMPVMGCDGEGGAAQPFGSHQHQYAAGSILPNHRSQSELDNAVREVYGAWKDRYLKGGCGSSRYYVATYHDQALTVSEAHGYGMMISAYLAGHDPQAKEIFDGMYRYFVDHPSSTVEDLMAWSQDGSCTSNQGGSSASDGDLDIAYALLLADKQWGSGGAIHYRKEAGRVIHAILVGEVDVTTSWVRLGDWTDPDNRKYYNATRPSDFMPSHFFAFGKITGDGAWDRLTSRSYEILGAVQAEYAPTTGLLPDFVESAGTSPRPAEPNFLERQVDGEYSFNACRVPWRLGLDFLTTGRTSAKTMVQKITDWIRRETDGDPKAIKAGYSLDGASLQSYRDLAFVAPFGVGAMVDAKNQEWLNEVWDVAQWDESRGVYYSDTLRLLSMLVMSGNWWSPAAAPCPEAT
jgi:endo-1,4-beta-D-glucanase Y